MNFFEQTNEQTSSMLNNFVRENNMQKYISTFADLPIFFTPIFLISAWLYWTFKNKDIEKKRDLIYIFVSPILAVIINLIIQHFIHIKRPETFIEPILNHIPDASFPSDHAAVSFAFLIAIYLFGYRKIFWIFLLFVLLMDLSRIAWWVHWLWDIIAGMFIWWFSAFIVWKFRKVGFMQKITSFILKVASIFRL